MVKLVFQRKEIKDEVPEFCMACVVVKILLLQQQTQKRTLTQT